MKDIIFGMVCFFFLLLNVGNAAERDADKGTQVLSLQEFIREICKNDITFQEILIDNLRLVHLKDLNLPSSDIVLDIAGQYNFSLRDSSDSGFESTVSLDKLFPFTGTEFSTTYQTKPGSGGRRASSFTAMISQPVAQNAFGYMNRLEQRMLDYETDITKYQIIEAYEDYLASLIAIYYQWYSHYANLKTAKISLDESRKLLNNIKARKRFDIAHQSDVDRIELQVIQKQENLYTLEGTYNNTLELVYQATAYKKDVRIIPEFSAYYDKEIDFESEYSRFVKSGRTYNIFSLMEQKGSLDVKLNANKLLPSVNILFGYSKDITVSSGDPEETAFAGFSFRFPFMQQHAKAAYEISKIDEKQASLNLNNLKKKLETDLKNIYDQIKLEEKLIQSAEQRIILGQRIVKSETSAYSQARVSLSDLIKSINDLEDHKYNKVYHTVKMHTLKIEWLRLLDRLVKREDIKGGF